MEDLLFLVHRIPYPPDKGDKIRSFHELQHLSASYRIHLGAFVDSAEDWRHAKKLEPFCASLCLLPLNRWLGRLRSLGGLLTGEALTVAFYRNSRMRAWVDSVARERHLSAVMIFSSAMAQYAAHLQAPSRVLDFVDVDSQKWTQYSDMRPWPARWLYRREGERLLEFDRSMAGHFDHSLFVSQAEAELFAGMAPEAASRVGVVENGVDAAYFLDRADYADPYPAGAQILVFTGAMDYWPNADAVMWFADEIFPVLREACPHILFYVVGNRPGKAVRALQARPGITVTGRVDDVRPYLAHARMAVAPLRVARGIQNKVLEAMAMAKPLLATSQALEGIERGPGLDLMVADSVEEWVRLGIAALSGNVLPRHSAANREFVLERHDWKRPLARLEMYLRGY